VIRRVLDRRASLAGLAAAGALLALPTARPLAVEVVRVKKAKGCQCCDGWAQHLRAEGFACEIVAHPNMEAFKTRLGVPEDLRSCHTATMAGYVIEGHVPAIALQHLLAERPAIAGLAVPGMPAGSPGMPSDQPEAYEVLAFTRDGARKLFMRMRGEEQA
jgi:hypothetical protein